MNNPRDDHTPAILAIIATLAVVGEMIIVHFQPVPQGNATLVTQIQTGLIGGWMVAMGYYFSTTANSKKNAETIATQAQTIQTANAALAPVLGAAGSESIPVAPGETKTIVGTEDPTKGTSS